MQSPTQQPILTEDQYRRGRARAQHFSRQITPEADLLAELGERMNFLARFQAALDAGDFSSRDAGKLRGGIAYEQRHIEVIVSELESRERARLYGYRTSGEQV